MKDKKPYVLLLKVAFYLTILGMILTLFFSENLGVFGVLLIIIAFVMAIIASIKKRKYKKYN